MLRVVVLGLVDFVMRRGFVHVWVLLEGFIVRIYDLGQTEPYSTEFDYVVELGFVALFAELAQGKPYFGVWVFLVLLI